MDEVRQLKKNHDRREHEQVAAHERPLTPDERIEQRGDEYAEGHEHGAGVSMDGAPGRDGRQHGLTRQAPVPVEEDAGGRDLGGDARAARRHVRLQASG